MTCRHAVVILALALSPIAGLGFAAEPPDQAIEPAAGTLRQRCEQMLADQRAYDQATHAETTAGVLGKMTEEIRKSPIEEIIPLLRHSEWQIRYAAAGGLGGREEARVDIVRQALAEAVVAETNEYSLPRLIAAIGYTHATQAYPAVSDIIVSKHPVYVRRVAIVAQRSLQDPRSVPALLRATEDEDAGIVGEAIYALGCVGDKTALPRIRELAFRRTDNFQLAAVQALGMMRDTKSAVPLMKLLSRDDTKVLKGAAWSLGQIGYEQAVPKLIGLMNHANKDVRDASHEALLAIGNLEALEYFVQKYWASPEDEHLLSDVNAVYRK